MVKLESRPVQNIKIGILGGGQLGKMLVEAASPWNLDISIMDHAHAPASGIAPRFVSGDIKDYDQVMAFGKTVDLLTIEIEHVNTKALLALYQSGKNYSSEA